MAWYNATHANGGYRPKPQHQQRKPRRYEVCSGYSTGQCTEPGGWKFGHLGKPNFPRSCNCGLPWLSDCAGGGAKEGAASKDSKATSQAEEELWMAAQNSTAIMDIFKERFPNSEKLKPARDAKMVPDHVCYGRNTAQLVALEERLQKTLAQIDGLQGQISDAEAKAVKLVKSIHDKKKEIAKSKLALQAAPAAVAIPAGPKSDDIDGLQGNEEFMALWNTFQASSATARAAADAVEKQATELKAQSSALEKFIQSHKQQKAKVEASKPVVPSSDGQDAAPGNDTDQIMAERGEGTAAAGQARPKKVASAKEIEEDAEKKKRRLQLLQEKFEAKAAQENEDAGMEGAETQDTKQRG